MSIKSPNDCLDKHLNDYIVILMSWRQGQSTNTFSTLINLIRTKNKRSGCQDPFLLHRLLYKWCDRILTESRAILKNSNFNGFDVKTC